MLHLGLRPHYPVLLILLFASSVWHRPASANDVEQAQLARQMCVAQLPINQLSESMRAKVLRVTEKGQLFERSKYESFPCHPEIYRWLLESPDASLFAWRKLGATKATATRQENGSFLGSDGVGGEMRWYLIATGPQTRVWYAEGAGRIGPLLPTMTLRALVFLHFQDVKGTDGRAGIKHRLDVIAQYDSNALVNKLTSMTADTTGKKVMQQLEMFFSGMAWYISEHSAWSKKVLTQWPTTPEARNRLQQLMPHLEPVANDIPPLPPESSVKQTGVGK